MPSLTASDRSQTLIYGIPHQQTPSANDGMESGSKVWNLSNSSALYRVRGWGAPYFRINERGNMAVRPRGDFTLRVEEIDMMKVVQRVTSQGMATPLIIRFSDVLLHRLTSLHVAFEKGILCQRYPAPFQGVFPVKCSPDRFIVEAVVDHGKSFQFGLETGSKPELVMAISVLCGHGHPDALLICNGYKDVQYVHLALLAGQLGIKSVIVLEQVGELDIVVQVSERLGVHPVIGVRAKLGTKHDGHWGETSGEKGKFGLSPSEIVGVVSKLRRVGMLTNLKLLHFHIGSQIPSLELVNDGVSEAAHIFCELALMGAGMKHIDIGGGLGVDYDGLHSSSSEASMSYTLDEYAGQVVRSIKAACVAKSVQCPIITCESGRGLVSHHSVLVFDVLSAHKPQGCGDGVDDVGIPLSMEGLPLDMAKVYDELSDNVRTGKYDSALKFARALKMEGARLFKIGSLSLESRAFVDRVFEAVKSLLCKKEKSALSVAAALDFKDDRALATTEEEPVTYHINLSVFKSLPDSWAIGQLFPFAPLHRHEEEPSARAILSDLTCDSDGKVTRFIGHGDEVQPSSYLRVHQLKARKPYYIGMFLAGAYQEVLGSLHNLFGMPNVIHVSGSTTAPDRFRITRALQGQSVGDVLRVMQYCPDEMFQKLEKRVRECIYDGRLRSQEEGMGVLHSFAHSFGSYTYLNTFCRSIEHLTAVECCCCA